MVKKIKTLIAISGILLIILGILFIANPGSALTTMAWLIGFTTLLAGIIELTAVLNAQEMIPNSGTRVLSAVFQIIVGFILLANKWLVAVSLPIMFSIWVMIEGIIVVVKAFDYKKVEYKWWWCVLLLGVAGAILGFCALVNPVKTGVLLSILVGIGVLTEGISYLVTLGGINRFQKRVKEGVNTIREKVGEAE